MTCLQPLEFNECVIDSPEFREKLSQHEKEIDSSYKSFKEISNCIKDVYKALEDCSEAFKKLANTLDVYKNEQDNAFTDYAETEDEKSIKAAISMYTEMIYSIETMRNEHLLGVTKSVVFEDMQKLREDCLTKSKHEIKEFKKITTNYYQKLDKYVATKFKSDFDYSYADNDMAAERKSYTSKALDHVMNIQQTQEEKTYRLVHTLSLFIQMLNTYHHQAWDNFCDQKKKMDEVNCALFRTEQNYLEITENSEKLKQQLLSLPSEHIQKKTTNENIRREGYLFVQTKKNVVSDIWTRNFCVYDKTNKTMTLITSSTGTKEQQVETLQVEKCQRRQSNSIDRRFCFDVEIKNKQVPITFQALSKEDLSLWMTIMDGKEPVTLKKSSSASVYARPVGVFNTEEIETLLNEKGYRFLNICIKEIEKKGLESQGLYRMSGRAEVITRVMKQVSKELKIPSNNDPIKQNELTELDINTLCSIVKSYLKHLREPLATFDLYPKFIEAGKNQNSDERFVEVTRIIKKLPNKNFCALALLIRHLKKVSEHNQTNLMTPPNLGVCFSPTIFRAEETTASLTTIRESKFAGDVITLLIEKCHSFFPPNQSLQFSSVVPNNIPKTNPTAINNAPDNPVTPLRPSPIKLNPSKSVYASRSSQNTDSDNLKPTDLSADDTVKSKENHSPNVKPKFNVNLKRHKTELASPNYKQYTNANNVSPTTQLSNKPAPPPILHPKPDKFKGRSSLHETSTALDKSPSNERASHDNNQHQSNQSPNVSNIIRQYQARSTDMTRFSDNNFLANSPTANELKRRSSRRAKTLYMYIAEDDTQLSFQANKLVTNVIETEDHGWIQGIIDGKIGLVPSSYVEMLPL